MVKAPKNRRNVSTTSTPISEHMRKRDTEKEEAEREKWKQEERVMAFREVDVLLQHVVRPNYVMLACHHLTDIDYPISSPLICFVLFRPFSCFQSMADSSPFAKLVLESFVFRITTLLH